MLNSGEGEKGKIAAEMREISRLIRTAFAPFNEEWETEKRLTEGGQQRKKKKRKKKKRKRKKKNFNRGKTNGRSNVWTYAALSNSI
ncbi:hypothetical protein [Methanosarcina siciliae]|uniref:hypothetical protein n=1 Tax=Methanosarcina siciliae TaxID=38027 RepID=UPI0018CDA2B2|nr:hypothetical protein [Methanosarcina siciliae]